VDYDDLQKLLDYGEEIREGVDEAGLEDPKVKSLQPVEEIHNLNSLDKVDEIIPIDADLAEQMRSKVGSSSTYEVESSKRSSSSSGDLNSKVQRIYNLFGINDIDDIIKVVPIRSMKKLEGGYSAHQGVDVNYEDSYKYSTNRLGDTDRYLPDSRINPIIPPRREDWADLPATVRSRDNRRDLGNLELNLDNFDNRGLGNNLGSSASGQSKLDNLNREISLLNDDINIRLTDLVDRRNDLGREHEFITALDQMVGREQEKIQAILQVKQDHQAKAVSIKDSITTLRAVLERSNADKIRYLDQLRSMVDLEKKRDIDTLGRIQTFQVPELSQSRGLYGNSGRQVRKEPVSPLHGSPLVKVKNLTKVNNILPLSVAQGEELKKWQEQRN